MRLHENRHINFFLTLLYILVIALAGYVFFKYIFRLLIPLLIAYLLSQLIIRPVNWLSSHTIIPRQAWSALCTLLCVTAVGSLLVFVIYQIVYEGVQLFNSLPAVLAALPDKLEHVRQFIDRLLAYLPDFMASAPLFDLETWLSSLSLPQIDVGAVWSSLTHAVSSIPGILITVVFVFVSTYFLTSDRLTINAFIHRQLSAGAIVALGRTKSFLSESLLKWLRAQAMIISITFFELLAGFFLMRQPYALVLALLIAIVDALPILGVGTVLVPWAVICLFSGETGMAISLCVLYGVILVVRNVVEPRIVGGQLGLHPFVALLCIYFGYRIAGFAGMFVLPVLVLVLIKLHEWEYIRIWK